MLNIPSFYPTPALLASKMLSKIKGYPTRWLEPSAGKGDLAEQIRTRYKSSYGSQAQIFCIEKDNDLQATLRGKGFTLLDSDFLTYSAPDQFDAILMNPPFESGENHLLKAIEIMYRGQIVCLLNAETIRHPFTNNRRRLAEELDRLGAEVEYVKNAFVDAERKTAVEVALIYINIEAAKDEGLFSGVDDEADEVTVDERPDRNALSTGKTIEELVATFNETVNVCTRTIVDFYKTRKVTTGYLSLATGESDAMPVKDKADAIRNLINQVLIKARRNYWRKVLELKEVRARLTEAKRQEFDAQTTEQCNMDFTESNVRQFVLNLIGSYEQTLTEAVVDVFDKMSRKFAWDGSIHCKNTHYFNGWKTNDAFKVGKKVIIPFYGSYGGPFRNWNDTEWHLDYKPKGLLTDIDLVMNYFDAMTEYDPLVESIEKSFAGGANKGSSTYFDFVCYKKGTIHLTFRSENILRRFNVTACKGKGWLPGDYGARPYEQLSVLERELVEQFEVKHADYVQNQGQKLFAAKNTLQITI
jgi:hypothetical protein